MNYHGEWFSIFFLFWIKEMCFFSRFFFRLQQHITTSLHLGPLHYNMDSFTHFALCDVFMFQTNIIS